MAQVRNNVLDLSYTASYRDSVGLTWASKLSEANDWKLQGFTGGAFADLRTGPSKLTLSYDVLRGYKLSDPVVYRYGLTYRTGGPNSSLNLSLFNNDGFNNLKGWYGKLDLSTKFK